MEKRMERREKEWKEELKIVKAQQGGEPWYTTKYPQRLIKKAEDDEYIDLIELREEQLNRDKPSEESISQSNNMELILREKSGTTKKEVTTPAEFMILAMSYINLLRHIGHKGIRRSACAIKYFQWIGVLLYKNIYTIKSVFAFDKATRQIKAKSYVWDYDSNIASANLVYYLPSKEPTNNTKRVVLRGGKQGGKRHRDGSSKSSMCKHYAAGSCMRTPEACRFSHRCDSCKTGAGDNMIPPSA